MKVLSQTRRFFCIVGLGPGDSVQIGRVLVPKPLVRLYLLLMQICCVVPEILSYLHHHSDNIQLVIIVMHRLIHYAVHFATYMVWIANIDDMALLADELQQIIDKRE